MVKCLAACLAGCAVYERAVSSKTKKEDNFQKQYFAIVNGVGTINPCQPFQFLLPLPFNEKVFLQKKFVDTFAKPRKSSKVAVLNPAGGIVGSQIQRLFIETRRKVNNIMTAEFVKELVGPNNDKKIPSGKNICDVLLETRKRCYVMAKKGESTHT